MRNSHAIASQIALGRLAGLSAHAICPWDTPYFASPSQFNWLVHTGNQPCGGLMHGAGFCPTLGQKPPQAYTSMLSHLRISYKKITIM